jgi:hypothetical protein
MMRVICRLGFIAVAMLAIASFAGQIAAEEARPNAGLVRFEVSAVKAARPFLIEALTALQQGNVQRAKEAFEAYDSAWNGSAGPARSADWSTSPKCAGASSATTRTSSRRSGSATTRDADGEGFHHHGTLCIAAYGFLISERETIPPLGTSFPRDARKTCHFLRLPTPRCRRSGPSGTSPTRSPPAIAS